MDPSLAQAFPTQFFTHLQQPSPAAQQHDQAPDTASQQQQTVDMQQDPDAAKEGLESVDISPVESAVAEDCETGDRQLLHGLELHAECSTGQLSPASASHKTATVVQPADHPSLSSSSLISSSTPRVQTVQPLVSSNLSPKAAAGQQAKLSPSDTLKTRLSARALTRSAAQLTLNGECSTTGLHGNLTGRQQRALRRGLEDMCSSATPGKGKRESTR